MTSRIVRAETFFLPLRYSLMPGEPVEMATLDHIFLRLETDDGLVGWGEGFGYLAAPLTYTALTRMVGPALIGMDAQDIKSTCAALDFRFHQAGRHGGLLFALSAVDIALWDIAGKRAGVPVAQLVAGVKRPSLDAYASLLRMADADRVARRVAQALAEGYGAIKLHEIEERYIRAARRAWPRDRPFMLDINCAWSAAETRQMDRALADCAPTWFEEPIHPPDDFAALADLRRDLRTPVAAGENAGGVPGFRTMMQAGAVDFAQPSVTKVGGITGLLQVFDLAQATGTSVRPHRAYFGPGYWANIQVLAATAGDSLAEFYYVGALPDSPYGDAVFPVGGKVRLPTGPGLGMDPDLHLVQSLHRPPVS